LERRAVKDAYEPTTRLITDRTTNGSSEAFQCPSRAAHRLYMATIAGTGAVAATVTFEGSCDGDSWLPIATAFSLTASDFDSEAVAVVAPWPQVRVTVASISGTGAKVNAWMSF
jgi:alpha-L-arabinofuranosidase